MTPVPPYLPPVIHEWNSEELFYIVKHGVKFTGMPAWPAQTRDDEVWAMVAFLNEFPKLDAKGYRQLVSGGAKPNDETAPIPGDDRPQVVRRAVLDNCRRCHGSKGEGIHVAALPKLAGQKSPYLAAALQAYARGERHSGIMQPIAASLSSDEIRQLAQYYSVLAPGEPAAADSLGGDPAAIQRGATIAQEGIPSQRVPRCAECHPTEGESRNPHYPNLAGQFSHYLVLQLELFKKRHRGGSPYAKLMYEAADRLTAQQMRDVALYYESLKLPTATQPAQRSPEN
jgi:cytochrome c553